MNAWCGCPPCEAVHDVDKGAVRRPLVTASVYDKYDVIYIQRIDWMMGYELCDNRYIDGAYTNGRLQCKASPFVGMYALTYFGVMHLHFCLVHCFLTKLRCIRVSIGARHSSLGQNIDSMTIPSCVYMQCDTDMTGVNTRCECGTHGSQLSAMHGKSLATKWVHTYKTVPDQLQL